MLEQKLSGFGNFIVSNPSPNIPSLDLPRVPTQPVAGSQARSLAVRETGVRGSRTPERARGVAKHDIIVGQRCAETQPLNDKHSNNLESRDGRSGCRLFRGISAYRCFPLCLA